ncbi:hypothetical protein CYMTET_10221 [Cymbomonas tetramitiformis]|uniref:EGF-like domain-containing protein n=1 Tax=Cymbomonas tetramitiformis TaxID=36881 RepID=A0AAE0GPR2_9CHLO|nr:hypothetical protein CYMTET_10221 [Cymbomonas tetramitiformis]
MSPITSSPITRAPATAAPSLTPPPPPPSPPPPTYTLGATSLEVYYQATPESTCMRVNLNASASSLSTLAIYTTDGPSSLSWGMDDFSCVDGLCGVNLCGFSVGSYSVTVSDTQTFTITFTTMSYTDISANTTFHDSVIESYSTAVSSSAGVPPSQVAVTNMYAGSTIIETMVNYTEADIAAGASPDSLASILSGDSASLADMFGNSDILADYASAGISATTAVTTSLIPASDGRQTVALVEEASAPEPSVATSEEEEASPAVPELLAAAPEAAIAVPQEEPFAVPPEESAPGVAEEAPAAPPEELVSTPIGSVAVPKEEPIAAVPEDLASAVPEDLASAVPEDLASAVPEDLASAVPEGPTAVLDDTSGSSSAPADLTSESEGNNNGTLFAGSPPTGNSDSGDINLEETMGSACDSTSCSLCTPDGCLDENGCAADDVHCYGECIDVQAPGNGHACAACPAGMVGDGITCATNLCYDSNGGCDPAVTCRMVDTTGTRVCGECPRGKSPVDSALFSSGWKCAEVDGCADEPCWSEGDFSQTCEDVAAPGTGRVCGACPSGFVPSIDGGCADVDECQEMVNGGCWISQEDPSIRTNCQNTPGSHFCTACPERFIGTGEAGCRMRVMCDTNYGNCDPLAISCTDNIASGYAECGPCPAGYSGTGDTVCVDADGCVLEPCFPGVECTDTQAPDTGRTCGACPEGYRGDGASCEKCDFLLNIDGAMGTVVDGEMKRSFANQLLGVFTGLSASDCILTEGVQYMWDGVTSDGIAVPLDEFTNTAALTLYLPKSTLTANVAYSMRLTASLRGNRDVSSTVTTAFIVKRQALVALIQGGGVQTGEGLPVELDAGVSYDPDDEPGDMAYSWACTRNDTSTALDEEARHCRDTTGALLPARMTRPALSLMLQGAPQGASYTLTCDVMKGDRQARAIAHVVIVSGSPPVPLILPMRQLKHTANTKLTLTSQVQTLLPDSLAVEWSMTPVGKDTEAVALIDIAATPLDRLELVVQSGTLAAGGAYLFTLTATDANGPAWVGLEVRVNSPPHSGSLLAPSPSEGVMLETQFVFEGSGWEDDVEDKPLWYQLRFAVVGATSAEQTMLSQWQPSPAFSTSLPAPGLEAFGHAVAVYLYVKDALEATTLVSQNVVVRPLAFQDEAAQEVYVDGTLEAAAQGAANGEDTSNSVLAVASIFGDADTARDSAGGNVSLARLAQREAMMDVVNAVWEQLVPTTDTVTRMAQSTAAVGNDPAELTTKARADIRGISELMVATTLSGNSDARLTMEGAAALASGLSNVAMGALGAANQSAEVAAAVDVMRSIGLSNAQSLVPGEEAVSVATETLSSVVQCEDLSARGASVASPTGSHVSIPDSVGKQLGASAARVNIVMTGCAVDPHKPGGTSMSSSAVTFEDDSDHHAEILAVSNVTSISMYDNNNNSSELAVHQLEEAITFTLPIHRPPQSAGGRGDAEAASSVAEPFYGARCVYWDQADEAYRSEGCTTLPNPTPPGSSVYWRTVNVSGMTTLAEAWTVEGVEDSNLTAGCEETWRAVYPEYLGTDAGYRKYLGAECGLTGGGPTGSNVSCWWEWRSHSFEGPGCVWADETGCLCTHLTDFAAAQQTEMGSTQPPDRVSVYSTDDMGRVSFNEVAKSVVLLSVLAVFMLGAPTLYLISNYFHNRERLYLLLKLVDGRGQTFKEIDGMWTWSIVDKREKSKDEKKDGNQPTLGSMFAELAAAEKARLDGERLGLISKVKATSLASKWKRQTLSNKSGSGGEPSGSGGEPSGSGGEPAKADGSEQGGAPGEESVLQKRLRSAWKRNAMSNMFSTAANLTLKSNPESSSSNKPPSPTAVSQAMLDPPGAIPEEPAVDITDWEKPTADSPSQARSAPLDSQPAEAAVHLDMPRLTCKIEAPSRILAGTRYAVDTCGDKTVPAGETWEKSMMSRPWPLFTSKQKQITEIPKKSYTMDAYIGEVVTPGPLVSMSDEDPNWDNQVPPDDDADRVLLTETTTTTTTTTTTRSFWAVQQAHLGGSGPVAESYQRLDQESPPATPDTDTEKAFGPPSENTALAQNRGAARTSWKQAKKVAAAPSKAHHAIPTARTLFSAMRVNIFRLQLCIPLDYLEEQAKLQMSDSRRRQRCSDLSTQALADVGQELKEVANATMTRTVQKHITGALARGGGPVMESFQEDDAEIKAEGAEKRHEAAMAQNELQSLLNSQAANGRVSTPPDVILPLDTTARFPDEKAALKAKRMWKMLQKRTKDLPVERMIGTAMVQAFLGIKAIMSKVDLAEQAHLAAAAPWQMPNNRPFTWWVSAFKVLIGSVARTGWYKRSALWNAIFLQRVNGSFEMSPFLAMVLKAGEPLEDLAENPLSPFDVAVLKSSVPTKLRDVFMDYSKQDEEEVEDALILMQECWATILVNQWLETVPFSWTENPNDDPAQQVTLRGRSEMFLRSVGMTHPRFDDMLPELKEIAARLVAMWAEDHDEKILHVFSVKGPAKSKAKLARSFADMTLAQRYTKLMQLSRRYSIVAKRNIKWLAKAHPLGAIYLITATEPFSRSERILIQTNTFILMLVFTVWFYYSKAVNCCKDFRVFVDCPDPFEVNEPCLGYDFCAVLKEAGAEEMLPDEILPTSFFCTAFPQSSFTGRMWVILIIVGILTPVTMILSQCFIMAANANVPGHWGIYVTKKAEKAFGAAPTAVMQTIFVTLYAIFFNFQKFNKAVAVTMVAMIGCMLKPHHIQRAIAFVLSICKWIHFYTLTALSIIWHRVRGTKRQTELTEEEELLKKVHLISPVEQYLQKLAYFCILVAWVTCAFSLLTYSMLIREMMGADAETELIRAWATVLAVEMFGKEAIKLIVLRLSVDAFMQKIEKLFTSQDHPAFLWFEQYIMTVIMANAKEMDDSGDQDMGDDADADGGGDDEVGGDNEGGAEIDV